MKMELTAALLHSPEVLFLDEPTIGLDVVAQHNIQQFLNYYQEKRRITILLTSHYMKDVAALCKRVVIITQGQIKYDGSLSGILDRFSGSKIVTLQLPENEKVDHPEQLGEVLKIEPPKIKLRVPRQQVPSLLSRFLDHHVVEDIMVEDPPLEEVIASLFAETSGDSTSNPAPSYPRSEST